MGSALDPSEFSGIRRFRDLGLTRYPFSSMAKVACRRNKILNGTQIRDNSPFKKPILPAPGYLSQPISMRTMFQLRSVDSNAIISVPAEEHSGLYYLAGRLIQITLVLYLLPALLVVLVVGAAGLLALKIGRILKDLFAIHA